MLVKLCDEAIEHQDCSTLLGTLTYKNQHEVFVELADTTLCESIQQKLGHSAYELLDAQYTKLVTESRHSQVKYWVGNGDYPEDPKHFNVDEAIRFFRQPVSILLENGLNDSYFVLALFKYYDKKGKLKRHYQEGWLEFENAGGCTNIPNSIDTALGSFKTLSKIDKTHYLRYFVLFDSDRAYPGMPLKPDKEKVHKYLTEKKIPFHILEKREMESYLPDEVIQDLAKKHDSPYLKAYLTLRSEQKDHFDMEKGLKKNRTDNNWNKQEKDLYNDLTDDKWKVLKNGIDIEYVDSNFKKEFPKNFEHPAVNRATLGSRCGTKELQEIVDAIKQLL
jgi:hypothetical protein